MMKTQLLNEGKMEFKCSVDMGQTMVGGAFCLLALINHKDITCA